MEMQAGILEQSVRDNYLQMLLRPGCDLKTYGDAHCLASKASYCSQGCVPAAVGSPYYCKGFDPGVRNS
mgnify:CR=1 FL=1